MPPPGQTAYRFRYALLALAAAATTGVVYHISSEGLTGVNFWLIFIAILTFLQFIFLAPRQNWPIELTLKKRPLRRSVIVAAIAATLLSLTSFCTLSEWIGHIISSSSPEVQVPDDSSATQPAAKTFELQNWHIYLALALIWTFWAVVFWFYLKKWDRYDGLYRVARHLLVGTILQLFVAIAAQAFLPRKECECSRGSWIGLLLGGTLLVWVFGPALILVFMHEKVRLARLDAHNRCPSCLYNLTGTRASSGTLCPECGHPLQ